ncbi:MAG: PQQ-binding-like beta-propeller repeat protein [Planctomycetes bacterium]|nr:PQQ-binding-like beta-propeller repeat protein [Planctomycetota bacterium]
MPVRSLLARCLFSMTALTLAVAAVHADNWERFRGPNGDGVSNDKNIPVHFSATENVRWKAPLGGGGHSSPIVWGDRLFLQTTSDDGSQRSLICFDANKGTELWRRSIPGKTVKIRFDSSLASATPTTDGEAVYVPFWNGKDIILTAYNFKGDKLWDRNLGEFVSQHGAAASPILYKDLLIFSLDKDAFRNTKDLTGPVSNPSTLYALNKKTGKTVWAKPRDAVRACYSAPFLLQSGKSGPELIVTSTSAITSYEPASGKINWNWKWTFVKDPLRTIAATVHADGHLLACSGDGSGERLMVAVALNGQGKEAKPAQVWDNKKEFPYVTCMLVRGEHVFFVNDLGRAGCFEIKTGKKMWFETIPDAWFYASPVMIDGKIYACSEQGDVYVFAADAGSYQQIARNKLGGVIRATPAIANGALYVRTENTLYCIGKK